MLNAVQSLSQWYRRKARPLPWRESQNPYPIWISEVMLQQTQVAAVIPYFHRFLERFPTLKTLAIAPLPDVLALWSGLGYYSRARNLQKGAQYLMAHHEGNFPRTREEIERVPGIGPYTAGAILSIAFDLPEAIVDGNVQRVFARYYGIQEEIESPAIQKLFWTEAKFWVAKAKSPRDLNQALMELGATVCTKSMPKCDLCPIQNSCTALAKGWQADLPRKRPRKKPVDLWWKTYVFEKGNALFLKQNGAGEWWEGLWDFPSVPSLTKEGWGQEPSFPNLPSRRLAAQEHTVTHHRIHVAPFHIDLKGKFPIKVEQGEWFLKEKAESLPLSSLARKILAAYLC